MLLCLAKVTIFVILVIASGESPQFRGKCDYSDLGGESVAEEQQLRHHSKDSLDFILRIQF